MCKDHVGYGFRLYLRAEFKGKILPYFDLSKIG